MLVTTTSLQLLDPDQLRPAREPEHPAVIVRVDEPAPEFARFLYSAVGGDWHWTDRLPWNLARWTEWLSRPGSETWVAWVNGAPAGYVELDARPHDDGTDVEIAYFGLLGRFIGRGLGGQLLTEGIRRAWTLHHRHPELPTTTRAWVHTCTLDGPHALRNYTARGFQIYDVRESDEPVADTPPAPWPRAHDNDD